MTITVLSQPGCAACRWVEKTLEAEGLAYTVRDVRTDPAGADLLRGIYARLRPGMHPATPVTLIDDGIVFGPDIRSRLRELRQEAAA
ncbi:glutaredoxin domain-containing protein [Mycobacteroides abscessus]|uniref:glutaredoxin domain-containing protein n=1 Tax=Mycobacteroides abscessus TaxID=36809 RepID=UPI001472FC84